MFPSHDRGVSGNVNVSGDLYVDTSTLYVNSTANRVGINTSSPSTQFDVNGGIALTGTVAFTDGGSISFGASSNVLTKTSLGSSVVSSSLTSVGTLSDLTVTGNIESTAGDLILATGSGIDFGASTNVYTRTGLGSTVASSSLTSVGTLSDLTVTGDVTVDTDTLYVDSSNDVVNVGSTTETLAKFNSVESLAGFQRLIYANNPNTTANSSSVIMFGQSNTTGNIGEMFFNYQGNNDVTNRISLGFNGNGSLLNVNNRGNVGIGVTDPTSQLDVLSALDRDWETE